MPADNKLELVVTVEVDKANQSIKSVNTNLSNIEATSTKAARSASQGIDGMTASMVKGATAGNLLADAIQRVIDFGREWTIGAARQAAQEDRLVAVTRTLARVHGDGAAAAAKAIEAIRQIGYTSEDATTSVQKLIIADIGLQKAQGLARVAKDAAAVSTEGIGAAEAFEKIMLAIETGQSRGLRMMSLFVDLNKAVQVEELKRGRTLTDLEAKQVRYNAVMRAATEIQGAAAAKAASVDGQMEKLSRELKELKDDVGRAFQSELKAVVEHLQNLVGWLKENVTWIEKFGTMAVWLAGILATHAIATKILGIAKAVDALTLALSRNPWALLITSVVTAGAVVYKSYRDMQEGLDARGREMENAALRQQLFAGKVKIDDLRKRGMTDEQIRELVSGRRLLPGEEEPWGEFGTGLPKIKIAGKPDLEALKFAQEIRKRQAENEKFFRERAIAAAGAGKTGFAKDIAEINAEIAKRTTFVDKRGVSHYVALTKAAWNAIIEEAQKKLDAFKKHFALDNKTALAEYLQDQEEVHRRQMEFEARRFQQRIQNDAEIAERNLDHLRQVYAFEEHRVGFERDARLRELEGADAQTLEQKIAVEQRKAEIEVEYLKKVHEVRQRLYDMDTSRMLLEEELTLKRLGYQADAIKARIAELNRQREDIRRQNQEATDAAIQAVRENAANRTAQLVREHNRSIFESLKQQAGGVFDALLQKSQSVWSAIANSFKTALLTAIKEVVTSRVAAMLMYLFTGQKVTFAGGGAGTGGSGGILGGLGGLLGIGAMPVFGGTGGPIPGGAVGGWGTPPFIPSTGGAGGGGLTSKAGVGVLGGFKGWKDLLSNLGNVGYRPERWRLDEMGNLTKIADARGIGGWQGGALLAGGSILALEGLRRGGWSGVAMTTAGGAMIGAKFGGPLGAAIGAGVGFVAGLVRLFVKSAEEKAREKIKALYGVDIADKGLLKQIVDTAKQAFGGNLDMAIRSQQIRDLIQLYAMSTGQPTRGMPATVHPLGVAQVGGSLYQSPGYSNGTALPGLGGLPTLDRIGGGVASGAGLGTTVVNLQIDSKTVGNVIIQNGRVVAQGAINAMKANAGRRELTALQVSPGLVTA
ncbi:MAG TPA: hypothetical protein PK157_22545 [Bryobacteraceae bacterium]|nr:hypothetical protein [Bryobacteraceae bacterium]